VSEAFFVPLDDGRFLATGHTSGPWDPAYQHAGPPAALLGRAMESCSPRESTLIARVTFEILGPVPVAEVEVESRVARPGRTVELLEAELRAGGRVAMTARAWRLPFSDAPPAGLDDVVPPPCPAEPTPPPGDFGYGAAVELRFARGGWQEWGPATVWSRLRVPIVPDEPPTPLQRVLAVADSGNGVSAVMDWQRWLFINPELTVHVQRPARGEWIVLDAETTIADGGAGVARSVLLDEDGPVAYGSQSLYVAPR
jgi:Thioesterase-like superfamily